MNPATLKSSSGTRLKAFNMQDSALQLKHACFSIIVCHMAPRELTTSKAKRPFFGWHFQIMQMLLKNSIPTNSRHFEQLLKPGFKGLNIFCIRARQSPARGYPGGPGGHPVRRVFPGTRVTTGEPGTRF